MSHEKPPKRQFSIIKLLPLITGIIVAITAGVTAIDELIKLGHSLGWW